VDAKTREVVRGVIGGCLFALALLFYPLASYAAAGECGARGDWSALVIDLGMAVTGLALLLWPSGALSSRVRD
jgi:hypothetical protein